MSAPAPEENNIQSNWLNRIKANDESALKLFYLANYPKVEQYILNNSGSIEEAKDIYQEAFVAMWRNIMLDKVITTHENSLNGYLFQIAKNKWLDVLRQKKRNVISLQETAALNEIPEQLPDEEANYIAMVKQHFAQMGAPCKEVLYRFYFKRENIRQIATRFSWTEATAKNNKYRCLQKLRLALLNKK